MKSPLLKKQISVVQSKNKMKQKYQQAAMHCIQNKIHCPKNKYESAKKTLYTLQKQTKLKELHLIYQVILLRW